MEAERDYAWVEIGPGRMRFQPVEPTVRGSRLGKNWPTHWSTSLGASTPTVAAQYTRNCLAAGVEPPTFRMGDSGQILIKNEAQARKLRRLHPMGAQVNLDSYFS